MKFETWRKRIIKYLDRELDPGEEELFTLFWKAGSKPMSAYYDMNTYRAIRISNENFRRSQELKTSKT